MATNSHVFLFSGCFFILLHGFFFMRYYAVFLKPSLSNCGFFFQEVNITALNLLCPLEHRRPCSLRGAATGGTACVCLLSIQYYTFLEGTHCIFQFYCEVYN